MSTSDSRGDSAGTGRSAGPDEWCASPVRRRCVGRSRREPNLGGDLVLKPRPFPRTRGALLGRGSPSSPRSTTAGGA
eukprot:2614958-Alexandrium_andersonii.AAC.1